MLQWVVRWLGTLLWQIGSLDFLELIQSVAFFCGVKVQKRGLKCNEAFS